jgi:phosphatidylglycerol:prolipoprotein diacylglycerol transferase
MENRAARRKAAVAAKRKPGRSRRTPGTPSPPGALGGVESEALVVSHVFDPGDKGEPFSATVRLTGRRVGINRLPGPRDSFHQEDQIDAIVPGSGPVSVTSWVYGLAPGDWTVDAELVGPGRDTGRGNRVVAKPMAPAAWSLSRWALTGGTRGSVHTRWAMLAPLARMPGVIPGSFSVLGAVGIVVALVVQSTILASANVAVSQSLVVSLIALALGLLGAKVWYAVLHPGPWRKALLGGWAVDGFLVVASVVAVVVLPAFELRVGQFLDATAPGMFFAVAIGRLGCFFTGCCAGRYTRSRWGVWSFDRDRRIGARRLPAQLLESAAGLVIGLVAGAFVLSDALRPQGTVFVGAVVAYLIVRQGLLRLRAERREYLWRRSGIVSGARS